MSWPHLIAWFFGGAVFANAIPHWVAGAMGRPVSILLPFAPDWRWLMERGDTPWYPSVTLCRQTAPGDWASAVAAMLRSLDGRRA